VENIIYHFLKLHNIFLKKQNRKKLQTSVRTIVLERETGKPIEIDVICPLGEGNFPLLVMSHGFRGSKDWGFLPYVAGELAKAGAIVIKFNFSCSGRRSGVEGFPAAELFAENTVTTEINDLIFLIKAFVSADSVNFNTIRSKFNGEILLWGHSRGAGVSVLAANKLNSDDESSIKINKLTLWASIDKFDRTSQRLNSVWKEQGWISYDSGYGSQLRINYSYRQDLITNQYDRSLKGIIEGLTIPALFIHGQQDLAVKLNEIKELLANASRFVEFEVIEKANHIFNITDERIESSKPLQKALEMTIDFLLR